MGKRIKKLRQWRLMALLLSVFLLTAGCAGEAAGDGADTEVKKEQSVGKKEDTGKEKAKGQIPGELLPGGKNTKDSADGSGTQGEEWASGQEEGVYLQGADAASDNTKGSMDSHSGAGTPGGTSDSKSEVITVSFEVESREAEDCGYSVYHSSTFTLKKGATVLDALYASGLSFEGESYVTSIGGLAEKQCGAGSGWKYYVNGGEPGTSCKNYILNDGDAIIWSYVRNP